MSSAKLRLFKGPTNEDEGVVIVKIFLHAVEGNLEGHLLLLEEVSWLTVQKYCTFWVLVQHINDLNEE